jgi:hypothetical protein
MRINGVTILLLVLIGVGVLWWLYVSGPGSGPYASASSFATDTLTSSNGSVVSGTVSFVATSDGQSTSVTVHLTGLRQGVVYGVTIHNGACLGPRLFILTSVTGDANGQGSSTTIVAAQPASFWFIVVHASASPDTLVVACGQVQVHVSGTTPTPNQQPFQMPNGGGGPPRTPIPTPGR